jgi:hypothetical protein
VSILITCDGTCIIVCDGIVVSARNRDEAERELRRRQQLARTAA